MVLLKNIFIIWVKDTIAIPMPKPKSMLNYLLFNFIAQGQNIILKIKFYTELTDNFHNYGTSLNYYYSTSIKNWKFKRQCHDEKLKNIIVLLFKSTFRPLKKFAYRFPKIFLKLYTIQAKFLNLECLENGFYNFDVKKNSRIIKQNDVKKCSESGNIETRC